MYVELECIIDAEKWEDKLIIIGNWSALVGEVIAQKIVGQFDLGQRNVRGEKRTEFCIQEKKIHIDRLQKI